MEYSVTGVAHTDRGWEEVLYRYPREWLPERNCWRDVAGGRKNVRTMLIRNAVRGTEL